jgi:hypothetical protein
MKKQTRKTPLWISSGTLYLVALVRTDVSENLSPPSSPHGRKSQKTFIIVDQLIKSDSMITQLSGPTTPKEPWRLRRYLLRNVGSN